MLLEQRVLEGALRITRGHLSGTLHTLAHLECTFITLKISCLGELRLEKFGPHHGNSGVARRQEMRLEDREVVTSDRGELSPLRHGSLSTEVIL